MKQFSVFCLFFCIYIPIAFAQSLSLVETNKIYVQLSPKIHGQFKEWNIENKEKVKIDADLAEIIERFAVKKIYCPFSMLNEKQLKGQDIIQKLKRTYIIEFAEEKSIDALIQALSANKEVVYAEKIPVNTLFYTPNDPQLANQWNLAKIDAANAWNIYTGAGKIIVAVVDDAVFVGHQDLQGNIYNNLGEVAGNGIDDDLNGYIDDKNGWDVADSDNNPAPPVASATNSVFTHGTHCSGIVGATTDNSTGIASIGFQVDVMPVKTLSDATPGPYLTNPYDGVIYAIAAGANVISMSWGGSTPSATNQSIMDLAYSNDILCVAAAGNSNTSAPMYPASYNHVLSVAATDINDTKASFSNYGTQIDVSAPGVDIYSTLAGSSSSYGIMSGTSMACPLVAGLAGLMRSYNPGASADFIESCIKNTTDNIYTINPSFVGQLGTGRINAYRAMQCMSGPPTAAFDATATNICAGSSVQFIDYSFPGATTWSWSFPGAIPATSNVQSPTVVYPTNGVYTVTLIVSNQLGKDTLVKTNYITVAAPTATISGGGIVNAGSPAFIQVSFTGTAPFSMVYTDGINNFPVTNITTSPYVFTVNPMTTTTYSLVSMSSSQCAGTVSGTALVNVSATCGITLNFQSLFGGSNQDIPRDVKQTVDCGYVVAGYTYSFGAGLYDAFLAKIDPLGQMSWFKTYGDSTDNTHFHAVEEVSNGYVMAGVRGKQNFVSNAYVVKTDLLGNVLWTSELQTISGGGAIFCAWLDVKEDVNGDIVLTGNSAHAVNFNSSGQSIVKLDGATGTVVWFNIYQVNDYEYGQKFKLTPGNGHIMAGYSRSWGATNGLFDFVLTKTDNNGAVIWSKNYGGLQNDYGNDVLITSDGGYITVGSTENFNATISDIMIIKTDSFGVLQWAKTYGKNQRDAGVQIVSDCAGGYLVSGTIREDSLKNQGLIFRIDATGNVKWAKSLGGIMNDGENIGMSSTGDCGAIITLNTQTYGAGMDDIWLIKTDSAGNFDCHVHDVGLTVQSISPSTITANLALINPYSAINQLTLVNTAIPESPDSVCTACGVPLAEFDVITNVMDVALINHSLSATYYHWDFGDGGIDSMANAVHEYLTPGTYTVTLVAFNECASDTFSRQVVITGLSTCIHRLQPGADVGKDATVFSRDDAMNSNDGGSNYIWMDTWTWNGNFGIHRGYLEFNLDNICHSATLLDGKLSLFYDPALGNLQTNPNNMWLNLVPAAWDEYGITWNNQPAINSVGAINIPSISGSVNMNALNVTSSVQQQIIGPNYGWMLQLQIEQTYQRNVFCTSDHPNPTMRPLLELTFDPIYSYTNIPTNGTKAVTICEGDSIQLTVAGYDNAAQNSGASIASHYLWIPSTGLSCDTCPNPKASPSESITYYAIAYNCPSCADIDTIRVNISKVKAEHDSVICTGGSVQLNATLPAVAWVNYSWTPTTGLSNPLIANPIANPSNTTTYIVYAVDNLGCNSQDTVDIVVAPYPILPTMRPDTSLCAQPGSVGTINVNLTNAANPIADYYYEWIPPTVTPDIHSPNSDGIVNLVPNSSQLFILKITNSDGCVAQDSIRVNIGLCYFISQNASICKGDTFFVGTSAYTLAGTYTDSLISSGGYDSTVTTHLTVLPTSTFSQNISLCQGENYAIGTHTYTNPGTYLDTLVNMWGCDSVVTTHIVVHPLPIVTIGNNGPVCEGQKLTMTASGGTKYLWSGVNNYISSQQNPVLSFHANPSMSGMYQVVVTTNFGCKDSLTTNVLIYPKPDVQKGNIGAASCGLPNGSASVLPLGGTLPYHFSWKPNVGLDAASAQNIYSGLYTIYISDANNCSDSVKLTVPDNPAPEVFFTSNPLNTDALIFDDTQIQFYNQSQHAVSYEWNFGDGFSHNLFQSPHTFNYPNDYTVTLIGYDIHHACPDTFSMTFHVLPHGSIYVPNVFTPNEDGDNDVFQCFGEGITEFNCVLYDRWGIEITTLNNIAESWNGKVRGVDAPEGTYTYKIYVKLFDGRILKRGGTVILIR